MATPLELWELADPTIFRLPVCDEPDPDVPEPLFLWGYRGTTIHAKRAFWKGQIRPFPTLRHDWTPDASIATQVPIVESRDFSIIPQVRIEQLLKSGALNTAQTKTDIPWEVSEQMNERSPQFTLRNIPRVERSVDLERATLFDVTAMPKVDAEESLEEVRNAKIPKAEMMTFWSAQLLDDFRIFLEEILYLCPWETMPQGRKPPEPGSLWSLEHSRSTLTADLIGKADQVFLFGTHGGPTTLARAKRKIEKRKRSAMDGGGFTPMG